MSDAAHDSINEELRRQFETRWIQDQPGPIEQYLPPPDSAEYLGTLEELVHIDLEFSWKRTARSVAGGTGSFDEAPRVEHYLKRLERLEQG